MYTAMVILDVLLASVLIALILLQQGKGADAGAAFGSGSSGTVFGAAGGASVMQKITTWVAVGFFSVTLGLSVLAKDRVTATVQQKKPTSVVQQEEANKPSSVGFIPQEAPQETVQPEGLDAIPESTSMANDKETSDESPVIPE